MDFQTDNTKIDQIMLKDQGEAQTTMTFDNVLAENFRTFQNEHETVWCSVARLHLVLGARTTARSPTSRFARPRLRLPLQGRLLWRPGSSRR